ncbi:MAG TPA: hypothetical protein VGP70_10490 [Actinomadura sp.]|jgi:hypothetical protein|nr:hypothetical protein [Actinomadura sp.]
MRVLVVLVSAFLLLGPGVAHADPAPGPQVAFTISDRRISESSGLAASRRHPGIVYTHNDSGGSPLIFAVGPDGRTKATFTLGNAGARDWEGIALGRDETGPALFVGDIGDNLGGAWPYVTVYRVPEPTEIRDQTLHATAFRLKYEDGPRNAESVLVDPRTNRLYIASKQVGGGLYEAPARLRTDRLNVLRRVGRAPLLATDGAYAPDGRSFVIRTYFAAHIYTEPGKLLRIISLPSQEQGESVSYTPDGRSLLAGSEGPGQPVLRVPVLGDAPAPPSRRGPDGLRTTAGERPEADPAPTGRRGFAVLIVVGIAGAIGYRFLRRRS